MTLEELQILITAQAEPLKKDIEGIKRQLGGLQNETNKATGGIKAAFKKLVAGVIALKIGQKIGQSIISGIKEAMNVEAAIQQIKRIMGESTNQFLKWAETQAIAFNMSRGEAIKYGGVFGNLISGFAKSTQEAMGYTTDLLKASSIIASSTGRSMQDVMERIRSGLLGNTEAIEDLGVNVNVAMIQSTDAFKKFANGRSWNQLSFQTQQQIRLMAILEQTNKKYGDTVNKNTNSMLQQLVAQLKNVQLSLGQAFMPIVQIILPALTALASKLAYVMSVAAQFSQALFGETSRQSNNQAKATSQQAGAVNDLGDAYTKAGKAAKGALAGFDEINALADSSGSGEDPTANPVSGLYAGMDGSMPINFDTNAPEISSKVKEMADKVKAEVAGITGVIIQNKEIIISALSGIAVGFAAFKVISNWSAITTALSGAFTALSTAIGAISWPVVAVAAAIALVTANIVHLWQTNEDFRKSVTEVWNAISSFVITMVNDMWSIVKDIWDRYGQTLIDNVKGFMSSIQNIILSVWESFLKPVIMGALEMLRWLWTEHLSGLIQQIGEFVMKLINGALEIYNGFIAPIVNWMVKIFGPTIANSVKFAIDIIGSLLAGVIGIAKGLFKALGGVIDFIVGIFTGNWEKAWQGVKDIFGGIFDSLYGLIKVPLNLIIDAINFVIRGLNRISIDIPDWVSKLTGLSGTWGFSISPIPKLARGGIVDSPTLAMVGEAGKEMVVPLENTSFVDKLASALGSAVLAAMQFVNKGNTQNGNIIIQLDGTTLARILNPYAEKESSRIGSPMIITT